MTTKYYFLIVLIGVALAMSLSKYNAKRNFESTDEPKGKAAKSNKVLHFVVQKHDASHLHYDFRLEADGVLKSWAVPKGPSLDPSVKRLAMMVEDHPYDYRNFEGIIPEGNYGAGTVMVWDNGAYIPLDENGDPSDEKAIINGLKKGRIKFVLNGKKIKGQYSLTKMKSREEGKDNTWLLIKDKDEYASKEDVSEQDRSVLTNRNLEEIAHDKKSKIHNSNQEATKTKKIKAPTKISLEADLKNAPKAKMPSKISPMLCKLIDKPFDSDKWLYELKWDGFRAIAEVNENEISLYSRNFLSFNERFPSVIADLKKLKTEAVFDGEIVVLNKEGKSDFQSLQNFQKGTGDLYYAIFDLLYYNGHDLRSLPLIERKELLKKALTNAPKGIIYSDHVIKNGTKFFNLIKEQQLEGIIGKEINSAYSSRRSSSWVKIKTQNRQEAIITGFTAPKGSRQKFGSLLLGIYDDKKLKYIGNVGTGFDANSLKDLYRIMKPYITEKCPFTPCPLKSTDITWLNPQLVCEVSFTEWTSENSLRHPVFVGLRPDKPVKKVKKELKEPVNEVKKAAEKSETKGSKTKNNKNLDDDELKLSNLDKVFWPEEGYTKGDLIEYYKAVSKYILPYLKDRPESLRRYPSGIDGEGFFQKNITHTLPKWVDTVKIQHSDRVVNYMLIQDEDSLLFAVNLGCVDLNPFNSRIKTIDNPDYMILDLDPEDTPFDNVIKTAIVLHKLLDKAEIPNYCKTSGSRGIHILVPMGAKYNYEEVKQFAQLIAQMAHEEIPEITSLERSPKKRQKKVYIDYLQNNPGATVAAPYSVRPKPGAPISFPLEWSAVKKGLDFKKFNIKTFKKYLKGKDPFIDVLGKGINMTKALKNLQSLYP